MMWPVDLRTSLWPQAGLAFDRSTRKGTFRYFAVWAPMMSVWMPQKSSGWFFALLYWCSLFSTLNCPLPPPVTGGVCLATRVRYRQSCGLDTWSALLTYLFVSRICVAGLCFLFFALVLFFVPLPSDQIGGGFLVCYFFLSFSFFFFFLDVAMVWKGKPASVTTGSRDRTYVRK